MPYQSFQITPFEAIYCDPQTYQHIQLEESIIENGSDPNNSDPTYLEYITQFMLDEIEADDVFLQNKIIGKNHVQWNPNYTYKAWYRAKNKLTIGMKVTPKTDPGAYVIEATGQITTHAGKEINIKPGFHAQQGSDFHAFIGYDDCSQNAGISPNNSGNNSQSGSQEINRYVGSEPEISKISNQEDVVVYPNPSQGEITIAFSEQLLGDLVVFSYIGEHILQQAIPADRILKLNLAKGHYLLQVKTTDGKSITKQIIVL